MWLKVMEYLIVLTIYNVALVIVVIILVRRPLHDMWLQSKEQENK